MGKTQIFFLRSKIKFILQVHVPILHSNVQYKNTQFVSGIVKFFIDAIFSEVFDVFSQGFHQCKTLICP